MILFVKKFIAKLITSDLAGKLIEIITRNQISFRGIQILTHYTHISRYIKGCLFWGLYEKQEAYYIEKYLPLNMPVIELGASIGVVSCLAAKKISPSQLYSIEANPDFMNIIENNLKNNKLTNCQVFNLAIASEDEELFFSPGENNTVGYISKEKMQASRRVKCSSLSSFIKSLGIDQYALISDIEGSEAYFIFNDPGALSRCKLLIIELHSTEYANRVVSAEEMKTRILNCGFEIVDSYGNVIVAKKLNSTNDPAN